MFDDNHTFSCYETRIGNHTVSSSPNLIASLSDQIDPTMSG
jgi:hypothetical protein